MHATPPSLFGERPGMTPAGYRSRYDRDRLRRTFVGAVLLGVATGSASAYTVTLTPDAPLTVYLQVGVGSFTNTYSNGGQPGNNTTINTVSAAVASAKVGNASAQAMTTDSAVTQSYLDGRTYCAVPGQIYIGGFYRTPGRAITTALVTATVPAALTDSTGDTIPFSKIRWTSSGNGDSGAEPFPAGTFVNGGVQNVGSMRSNTWNESCWAFSYANDTVPPAGTFTGVVRYTLSSP